MALPVERQIVGHAGLFGYALNALTSEIPNFWLTALVSKVVRYIAVIFMFMAIFSNLLRLKSGLQFQLFFFLQAVCFFISLSTARACGKQAR